MAMSILGVMILWLACSFYIYVAIRLWFEEISIRRARARASATELVSANLPKSNTMNTKLADMNTSRISAGMRQVLLGWRSR
jgi:hypothetical protein